MRLPPLYPLFRRGLSSAAPADAFPELDAAHPRNNIPPSIKAFVRGRKLLRTPGHPLAALRDIVAAHFQGEGLAFPVFEPTLSPVVSVAANFDELLTPPDHVSRRPSDTFYLDDARVLRCHMTAHQTALLRAGESAFLMAGDVYRRDTVDATHYPVFHQCDGVRVWRAHELPPEAGAALTRGDRGPATAFVVADLRRALSGLAAALFGASAPLRWVEDATFPFTDPSLELEVQWEGRWLEVLGAGAIKPAILSACGRGNDSVGWAFGCGLERLAMALHGIPDIRLFWSQDPRFLSQFNTPSPMHQAGRAPHAVARKFVSFSKYPACYNDLAFWLPPDARLAIDGEGDAPLGMRLIHDNDVHALVREGAGDLAESVERIDVFTNARTGRTSLCYRINYRATDRTLSQKALSDVHARVCAGVVGALGVEMR